MVVAAVQFMLEHYCVVLRAVPGNVECLPAVLRDEVDVSFLGIPELPPLIVPAMERVLLDGCAVVPVELLHVEAFPAVLRENVSRTRPVLQRRAIVGSHPRGRRVARFVRSSQYSRLRCPGISRCVAQRSGTRRERRGDGARA